MDLDSINMLQQVWCNILNLFKKSINTRKIKNVTFQEKVHNIICIFFIYVDFKVENG